MYSLTGRTWNNKTRRWRCKPHNNAWIHLEVHFVWRIAFAEREFAAEVSEHHLLVFVRADRREQNRVDGFLVVLALLGDDVLLQDENVKSRLVDTDNSQNGSSCSKTLVHWMK